MTCKKGDFQRKLLHQCLVVFRHNNIAKGGHPGLKFGNCHSIEVKWSGRGFQRKAVLWCLSPAVRQTVDDLIALRLVADCDLIDLERVLDETSTRGEIVELNYLHLYSR